jgi:hypothetical protein
MNLVDKKFSAVLSSFSKATEPTEREKAKGQYESVRSLIRDELLKSICEELVQTFSMSGDGRERPGTEHACWVIGELLRREFNSSASFLFQRWIDLMQQLPTMKVLPVCPDSAAIEAWRKKTQTSVAHLESELLSSLEVTYETAGADWLISKAKPAHLVSLFGFFISRRLRPKFLPQWDKVLGATLSKDRRGNLLTTILCESWNDDEIHTLAEVIRFDRRVLKTVAETLPIVIAHQNAKESAIGLLTRLSSAPLTAFGADREHFTVALARIGTGLLIQNKRSGRVEAALDLIQEAGRHLRSATPDTDCKNTWILHNLDVSEPIAESCVQITRDGAQHFAIAFEKCAQGFSAVDVLRLIALSVGLKCFGTPGETLKFDPMRHLDIGGGAAPGEPVTIIEPGWLWTKDIVIRAKVRPTGVKSV